MSEKIFPPFIKNSEKPYSVNIDMLIAMTPALIWAVYIFGARAAVICFISVLTAIICDGIMLLPPFNKNKSRFFDFSCVVTGLLTAFGLPVTVPLWMPALLSAFAVGAVKNLASFGTPGKNIFNPAATALAAFYTFFPEYAERFTKPFSYFSPFVINPTNASTAGEKALTSLQKLEMGTVDIPKMQDAFLGITPGTLGGISALLIIIGFLYPVFRGDVKPLSSILYVATVFVLTFFFPQGDSEPLYFATAQILSGSLLTVAAFMCNDCVTTPYTKTGSTIFAVGAGVLTVLLRYFGNAAAAGFYAVIIMNIFTAVLENLTPAVPFGMLKIASGKESKPKAKVKNEEEEK